MAHPKLRCLEFTFKSKYPDGGPCDDEMHIRDFMCVKKTFKFRAADGGATANFILANTATYPVLGPKMAAYYQEAFDAFLMSGGSSFESCAQFQEDPESVILCACLTLVPAKRKICVCDWDDECAKKKCC